MKSEETSAEFTEMDWPVLGMLTTSLEVLADAMKLRNVRVTRWLESEGMRSLPCWATRTGLVGRAITVSVALACSVPEKINAVTSPINEEEKSFTETVMAN